MFADYTAVMVFLTLLGWWLTEFGRVGDPIAEANRAEVFTTLSGFLGLAWAIRSGILKIASD